jgi:ankyrin repeat protein
MKNLALVVMIATTISAYASGADSVDGTTALHWAARRDDLRGVKELLAAGADANAANR